MRSKGKTHFIRVDKDRVVLAEIRTLQADGASENWFTDLHLQEVLQLLKATLQTIAKPVSKNKETGNKPLENHIITGERLRLGFSLKKRPTSQTCVLVSSQAWQGNQEAELESLTVSREKLVVYVCQLQKDSPQKMSQLVKVLGDHKQTGAQTVSISSYFKKIPSPQTRKQSQENSGSPPAAVLPKSPPSEGRRHAIKNIVNRIEDNKKEKRKGRRIRASRHDEDRQCLLFEGQTRQEKEGQDSVHGRSSGYRSSSGNLDRPLASDSQRESSSGQVSIEQSQTVSEPLQLLKTHVPLFSSENRRDVQNDNILNCSEPSVCSTRVGNVTITKVQNVSLPFSRTECSSENSVDLVTVDQMLEMKSQKSDLVSDKKQLCKDQETRSEDVRPIDIGDDDSDNEVLPSVSFIMKGSESNSGQSSVSNQNKTKPGSSLYALDRFSYKKPEQIAKCDVDVSASGRVSSDGGQLEDREKPPSAPVVRGKGRTVRASGHVPVIFPQKAKRKLPDFSSSDSDSSVTSGPNKVQKTKDVKGMKNNDAKVKTKQSRGKQRFSFSKTFFTGTKDTQPTLSAFMKSKESQNTSESKGGDSEMSDEELPSLDCQLIEELSKISRVKKESDVTVRQEIKLLSGVRELTEEHLQSLVLHSERYLRDIFEGKISCERHDHYKKGGKSRRDLTYQMSTSLFSDEQVDVVMETLVSLFCKRHYKYLDYLLKVLLPEMLVRCHMEVHGTTRVASDEALMKGSVT